MTDEPETFADAIAKLRTFGAWHDNDRINAVVAAHEREVAELNREMNNRAIIAAASIADGETAKKDATIAELKEALRKILHCRFGDCCIRAGEDCDAATCEECSHSVQSIASAALEKTEKGDDK